MDEYYGGNSSSERQRQTAAEIARKKVLAAYSSTVENLKNLPPNSKDILVKKSTAPTTQNSYSQPQSSYSSSQNSYLDDQSSYSPAQTSYSAAQNSYSQDSTAYSSSNNSYSTQSASHPNSSATYSTTTSSYSNQPSITQSTAQTNSYSTFKDAPINTATTDEEWKKYHSAWQDYYKNYYSEYYAKAAQTYLATEKMKNERVATGQVQRARRTRKLIPAFIVLFIILAGLFLQYNRLIFAPIMAYIVPKTDEVTTNLTAVDPTITQTVSAEPRLIIPKLNVDVPVSFDIHYDDVMEAMNHGVAHFSIPGANALPGQIGNLVISGHSAGDIYSSNPYKFIFSGLERLVPGDLIYINYNSTRYTYQITGDQTVEPNNVAALIYPTDKPILTLITCTPLGTSRYRLLVTAEQINPSYSDSEIAEESPADSNNNNSDNATMPANSPSFFENIWNSIFGN